MNLQDGWEWTVSGTAKGPKVRSVEVRINGRSWEPARDSGNSGFRILQYTVNTTDLANGRHWLEARAYDGTKYSTLSLEEFTVSNPRPPAPEPGKGLLPGFGGAILALAGALAPGWRRARWVGREHRC